jgi:NAD+ synthase (glutamine-hydrolysing)
MIPSIKIALAQLDVSPGHPDINIQKMLAEITRAKSRGMDLIIFSEMVVSGYLLGDEWENDRFVKDLVGYNEDLRRASAGLAVIWGNVYVDFDKKGEDGRPRKYNAAYIAQDGHWVSNGVFEGHTYKTLLPKYREFDDERHFFSMIKLAQEKGKNLADLLQPFPLVIKGQTVLLGAIMCEDMWCDDYSVNPTKILVDNGAEIILNLSCSPWTWRKNNKRHRVVKSLLEKSPVPFLYCNNVGTQNNGKNIFLFDGHSTVYHSDGTLMAVTQDYAEETLEVVIGPKSSPSIATPVPSDRQDLVELLVGLKYGLAHFFRSLPTLQAVIGLSGGIDSALVAYLLAQVLGPENVYAVNMPSKFNSDVTRNSAALLARNLGLNYAVFPIQPAVDLTLKELSEIRFVRQDSSAKQVSLTISPLTIENIQARDRSSRVLAALASCLGAVFVNNGNKTETALGYCTLYGDVDGAISPLGDIYKNEIYELARFINQYEAQEVIPSSILEVVPSAELSLEQDVTQGKGDPILYPYHDRLIRSFVEFRFDPQNILELYQLGTLEKELKIAPGLVSKYFPSHQAFIQDLEHKWTLFKINIFKRIQAPPIIAVSRRAFGFDLREAQNGVYFTREYQKLKKQLLSLN